MNLTSRAVKYKIFVNQELQRQEPYSGVSRLRVGLKITQEFPIDEKETRCCGILSAKCPVFMGLLRPAYARLFLYDPLAYFIRELIKINCLRQLFQWNSCSGIHLIVPGKKKAVGVGISAGPTAFTVQFD
jgi:hypothetical protein